MGHSSPRIGPSDSLRANGPGPRIVGPHNSPSKPFYPTSGLERRVLANPCPQYGPFSLIPHLCERFPRKSAVFQGIPCNPLVIYSRRLGVPDAPLNESPLRGTFMSGGSSDKVGKRNGRLFSFQILLETLNAFNSTHFALPIRRQAGGSHFRTDPPPSF